MRAQIKKPDGTFDDWGQVSSVRFDIESISVSVEHFGPNNGIWRKDYSCGHWTGFQVFQGAEEPSVFPNDARKIA